MLNPLISVIVPVYNIENFLDECLKSVVNQVYKNLEIILVDDGSSDSSGRLCDEWAQKDNRIKVIHTENGGAASARIFGMKAANGDYISLIDGDDWLDSELYSLCAAQAEIYDADVIMYDLCYEYPDRSEEYHQNIKPGYYDKVRLENEIYPTMLLNFNILPSGCTKVFKKAVLEKNIYDVPAGTQIGEDAAYTYSSVFCSGNMVYIDKALYHYRIFSQSSSHKYKPELYHNFSNSYYFLKKRLSNSKSDLSGALHFYLIYLVTMLVRNEMRADDKKSRNAHLKSLCSNKDIINSAASVNKSYFKFDEKILISILKKGNPIFMVLYISVFKKYNLNKGLIYHIKKLILKIVKSF